MQTGGQRGVFLLAITILIVVGRPLYADEFTSSSFKILDPVIAPSGFASSTSFRVQGSVSEPALGGSAKFPKFQLTGGFLPYPLVTVPTLSAIPGNHKVTLSWTEAEGFLGWQPGGYRIGQSTSSGGPYMYTPANMDVTSSNRTSLTNDTTYYFVILVEDAFENIIATSTEISRIPRAPLDITPSNKHVHIEINSSYELNIPSSVTDSKLDVSNIFTTTGATTTAVIAGIINLAAETSIGHVDVNFPSGISIRGPASTWDGVIHAPQVRSNSSVTPTPETGKTALVTAAIEIGADDVSLTFDKAVRILIADQAGTLVGYSRADVFTPITDVCGSDSQSVADGLSEGGDCAIDIDGDRVVWTKHFTTFVTYTQETTTTEEDTVVTGTTVGGHRSLPVELASSSYPYAYQDADNDSISSSPYAASVFSALLPFAMRAQKDRGSEDPTSASAPLQITSDQGGAGIALPTRGLDFVAFCLSILLFFVLMRVLRFYLSR